MEQFYNVTSFDEAKALAAFLVQKYRKGVEDAGIVDSKVAAQTILNQELRCAGSGTPSGGMLQQQLGIGTNQQQQQLQQRRQSSSPAYSIEPPQPDQLVSHASRGRPGAQLTDQEKSALIAWESRASVLSPEQRRLQAENQSLRMQLDELNAKQPSGAAPASVGGQFPQQQAAQPAQQPPADMQQQVQNQIMQQMGFGQPDAAGAADLETTIQALDRRREVDRMILERGSPLDDSSIDDDMVDDRRIASPSGTQLPRPGKTVPVSLGQGAVPEDKDRKREELRRAIDDLLKPVPGAEAAQPVAPPPLFPPTPPPQGFPHTFTHLSQAYLSTPTSTGTSGTNMTGSSRVRWRI